MYFTIIVLLRSVSFVVLLLSQEGYGAVTSGERNDLACAGNLTVTSVEFSRNEGGALAVFNGNLTVSDSSFADNTGTAVYFETSEDVRYHLEVSEAARVNPQSGDRSTVRFSDPLR